MHQGAVTKLILVYCPCAKKTTETTSLAKQLNI